jgi:hypothetical protein
MLTDDQITKMISDYIPKRVIPDDAAYKKQAQRVKENYMIEIQDAVESLAGEYRKQKGIFMIFLLCFNCD